MRKESRERKESTNPKRIAARIVAKILHPPFCEDRASCAREGFTKEKENGQEMPSVKRTTSGAPTTFCFIATTPRYSSIKLPFLSFAPRFVDSSA